MKISKWQDAVASFKSTATPESAAASGRSLHALKTTEPSAVINNINFNVFNAVDEFLYLNRSDRLESYSSLSKDEKDKFLAVISKLHKDKLISDENLKVDGIDEKNKIAEKLGERRLHGAKSYDSHGTVSELN